MSEWERSEEGLVKRSDDDEGETPEVETDEGETPEVETDDEGLPEPAETLEPQFDEDEAPIAEAAASVVDAVTGPDPVAQAAAVKTIAATTAAAKAGDPRAAVALRAMTKVKMAKTVKAARAVVKAAQSPHPATRAAAKKAIASSAALARSNRPGSYLPALAIAKVAKVQRKTQTKAAARGVIQSLFSRNPFLVAAAKKTVHTTAMAAKAGNPRAKFAFRAIIKVAPKKPRPKFVPPRASRGAASFKFSAGLRR